MKPFSTVVFKHLRKNLPTAEKRKFTVHPFLSKSILVVFKKKKQ